MESGRQPVEYVLVSSVRSEIVALLAETPRETDAVLDSVDASASAIYNALGDLQDEGFVRDDGGWRLTGTGRLVADLVAQRTGHGEVLAEIHGYLGCHDVAVLPREFRLRLDELAGCEILRATETDPHRALREVSERLGRADEPAVLSPIDIESFERALFDESGARLVVDERVARSAVDAERDRPTPYGRSESPVRVSEVDFALAVTDDELLLSLPKLEGGYDARTEVVVEHDRARRWGEDLFRRYWLSAVPFEQFVENPDNTDFGEPKH